MYRAFTLIEIITVLFITALSLYSFSTVFFRIQDHVIIQSEIDNLKSFIYQIRTKARYSKQNYSISINQDEIKKNWCVIAVLKLDDKQVSCDCFNHILCKNNEYYLYEPYYRDLKLNSNSLYPKVFTNIDGYSDRLNAKCLGIVLNNKQEVLQFNQNGAINVIQKNKKSSCR
ncbi:Type II secretory pathway, pseudopilin PulG [Nicoletella semolina]|nr:Type II secretory pathway, pseudopilin PulG [Nicoletella semolina]